MVGWELGAKPNDPKDPSIVVDSKGLMLWVIWVNFLRQKSFSYRDFSTIDSFRFLLTQLTQIEISGIERMVWPGSTLGQKRVFWVISHFGESSRLLAGLGVAVAAGGGGGCQGFSSGGRIAVIIS